MSNVANIIAIARREFVFRVRTRSFLIGTLILVAGVVAIAFVPKVVDYLDRGGPSKIGVYATGADIATDPAATLDGLLNAPTPQDTGSTSSPGSGAGERFEVMAIPDLAAGRAATESGEYSAVLGIDRGSDGELQFTMYTNDRATSSTTQLVRQASQAIAIADRLERAGVEPADQAGLFAPVDYVLAWPDPDRADQTRDDAAFDSTFALGFGMTILIFMMIILYGNWVAMSVVEEKSSRVMEVILNAATPFQLLSGKVLGVGAVAGVQYLAILGAGVVAIVLQGPVSETLLGGGSGDVSLPEGLTPVLLVLFGIYGVLGFLLYAVLFAAAGSLVSRQEDVNQVVLPMTLIASLGYILAVYSGAGLVEVGSGLIVVLSVVPFISPFLILSRSASGGVEPWEIVVSVALLVLAIGIALWIAARIYAAGVLLYGQRPGIRKIWRITRSGI